MLFWFMDTGIITFVVIASIVVFALWVLDLYLGSKFHLSKLHRRDENKMLKQAKDH